MNKILIAVAMAVFAMSAMLAPPAQAGWKGRLAVGLAIGALSAMSHEQRYEHRRLRERRYYARHQHTKKVYATKKSKPETEDVAKVEPPPLPQAKSEVMDAMVENENSSISTAALTPVEQTATNTTPEPTPEPAKVVAEVPVTQPEDAPKTAKRLDCKKFFPSVGMTLSVSCD
jgi:hypothetical protein